VVLANRSRGADHLFCGDMVWDVPEGEAKLNVKEHAHGKL
jgi:hypothetical protein